MAVPQWLQNIINRTAYPQTGRPPQALGYGQIPNTQRSTDAYSARLNALARYYGRVTMQGTMANLRRYEQMMPQYTARDTLFQQRYGMTPADAYRRYGNRGMLDYYKRLQGWRATADRYTAMALNYPMQQPPPPAGSPGGGMAGGGGGGYGGGGYAPPGGFGGGLPEWYLAIMNWRI